MWLSAVAALVGVATRPSGAYASAGLPTVPVGAGPVAHAGPVPAGGAQMGATHGRAVHTGAAEPAPELTLGPTAPVRPDPRVPSTDAHRHSGDPGSEVAAAPECRGPPVGPDPVAVAAGRSLLA